MLDKFSNDLTLSQDKTKFEITAIQGSFLILLSKYWKKKSLQTSTKAILAGIVSYNG